MLLFPPHLVGFSVLQVSQFSFGRVHRAHHTLVFNHNKKRKLRPQCNDSTADDSSRRCISDRGSATDGRCSFLPQKPNRRHAPFSSIIDNKITRIRRWRLYSSTGRTTCYLCLLAFCWMIKAINVRSLSLIVVIRLL